MDVVPREEGRRRAWTPARIVAAVAGMYVVLSVIGWAWVRYHLVFRGGRGGPLPHLRGGLFDIFVAPWLRWDAFAFLRVAGHGYRHGTPLTAFYPGYPGSVHAAATVLGGSGLAYEVAAIVISVMASALALLFLHRLVVVDLGEWQADRTVTYALLAPMTFFFFAPYSEALFLLLSVVSLLAARRGRFVVAGAAAALAAVTRPPGVLLVVPLAYEAYRQRNGLRARLGAGLRLVLPAAAFAAWYSWAARVAGESPAAAEHALHAGPAWPWTAFADTVRGLADHPAALINTVAVVLAVAGAVALVHWRRVVPLSYGLLAAVALIPMVFRQGPADNPWVSADRFAAVIFPLYGALALWTRRRPWAHRAYMVGSPLLLLVAFFVFTYNRFIG